MYDLFLYSANHGELIAYIGSDPYQGHWGDGSFFPQQTGYWAIGSSGQFTSNKNGELWLGFNDDAVSEVIGDNAGSVTADITVNEAWALTPGALTPGYSITFEESGLLAGTSWSIWLGDAQAIYAMAGNTITFAVPSGTYSYVVGPVAGYTASPSSGNVTVNGGNVIQPITFTIATSETPLMGVKNVVALNNVSIVPNPDSLSWTGNWTETSASGTPAEESFSIQQDFTVEVPSDAGPAYLYWVQNIIFVEGFNPQGWYAVGITNIYNLTGIQDPIDALWMQQPLAQNYVTLADNPTLGQPFSVPGTYTLTSYVSGGQVIMSNDFFNYTWTIPAGNNRLAENSSIVSAAPSAFLTPELVLVGPPPNTLDWLDVFLPPTSGSIQSYVQLEGQSWTSSVGESPVGYGLAASMEKSMWLNWQTSVPNTANFTAAWQGTNQQGVFYSPMAMSSTQNGEVSFDQTAQTGVSVSITGSSDPDGTPVAVTTAQLNGWQPAGTGVSQVATNPAAYYDVEVQGVSDGTATISIENYGVFSQTTMEYWNGTQWLEASDISVLGSSVVGNIPVSALNGTIIALAPILAITSFTASPQSFAAAGSTVTLSAAVGNIDSASLQYRFSIDGGQTWTSFNTSNTFVWNTNESDDGYHVLLVQVSDGEGQVFQSYAISFSVHGLGELARVARLT
jgi:hypothetical protein